ncbi:uncharacterized protein L969DRAFT_49220 [Mixia osmundae IAM 14324]|uniref:uncharacterized protein n=1 Tax=Mixia osmundae (strain CBS 9802 / IAM 14324 / JCM 22182 / KY 12970) TaxID=764103 RepID=UPI0004A552A5|nr:uncharacterized protein L969DRAFT_49220 [Mixia osmundae IAM 14324]KEI39502.1 hypothetical protein L969DRAFT_49220 [Mixia osmundae IAM 14324]
MPAAASATTNPPALTLPSDHGIFGRGSDSALPNASSSATSSSRTIRSPSSLSAVAQGKQRSTEPTNLLDEIMAKSAVVPKRSMLQQRLSATAEPSTSSGTAALRQRSRSPSTPLFDKATSPALSAPSSTASEKPLSEEHKQALVRPHSISDKQLRSLVRAIQKWGPLELRYDKVAREADCTLQDPIVLTSAIDGFLEECRKAVKAHMAKIDAMFEAKSPGLAVFRAKIVHPQVAGMTKVNAEACLLRVEDLGRLHQRIRSLERPSGFTITDPPVRQTYKWDCDWTPEDDRQLLIGVNRHGFGEWHAIRDDPELNLKDKLFFAKAGARQIDEANAVSQPGFYLPTVVLAHRLELSPPPDDPVLEMRPALSQAPGIASSAPSRAQSVVAMESSPAASPKPRNAIAKNLLPNESAISLRADFLLKHLRDPVVEVKETPTKKRKAKDPERDPKGSHRKKRALLKDVVLSGEEALLKPIKPQLQQLWSASNFDREARVARIRELLLPIGTHIAALRNVDSAPLWSAAARYFSHSPITGSQLEELFTFAHDRLAPKQSSFSEAAAPQMPTPPAADVAPGQIESQSLQRPKRTDLLRVPRLYETSKLKTKTLHSHSKMKFTAVALLAGAAAAVSATTPTQLINQLNVVTTDAQKLNTSLAATTFTYSSAYAIHTAALQTIKDINNATSLCNSTTGFTPANSVTVINTVANNITPPTKAALTSLINKKSQFDSFKLGSLAKQDINNLKNSTDNLAACIVNQVIGATVTPLDTAFAQAAAAYASEA